MKPIQYSAQITKVSACDDRTLDIKLNTQELGSDDASQILSLMQKQIYVAMQELPMKAEDIDVPETAAEFKLDKSPSQRFRNRLWVYYKGIHGSDEGFRGWYDKTLDTLGQRYLSKIDES